MIYYFWYLTKSTCNSESLYISVNEASKHTYNYSSTNSLKGYHIASCCPNLLDFNYREAGSSTDDHKYSIIQLNEDREKLIKNILE
jgi:hypothetical protein